MKDWHKGWMNTWMICPNDHGTYKGYTAPDCALDGRCLACGAELEGFRIINREGANA